MVRVAAKPSRPALRPAKASGCPTTAVAASATGSAPLRATSARLRRRRVCWRKRSGSVIFFASGGELFTAEKFPKCAGGCGPRTPFGSAAYIPRGGISQAVTLHLAIPSHIACPFPASRGPGESDNRYGYRTFLKGRTYCPGTQGNDCTQSFTRILPIFAVGARSGLLRRVRMLRKVGFAAHPKAPLCKGGCLAKRDWGIVTPPALDCCGRCICHRQHSLAGLP